MPSSTTQAPVLVMTHPNKILSSSPTSTDEIHDHMIAMDIVNDLNETNCVDRLTSQISEIHCTPPATQTKMKKTVIKTIHNNEIKVTKPFNNVLDLKVQLVHNTPIEINDIMIVRNGKEIQNSEPLTPIDLQSSKIFIMIRTKAKTVIPITLKSTGMENSISKILKIPLNIKVRELKKQIFSAKITTLKAESQRIIVGGKVLADNFIIGDYLLYALLTKPIHTKSSNVSSGATSPTSTVSTGVATKVPTVPLTTLYLSKTVNAKHEIDIKMALNNGQHLTCSLEISQPISTLVTIMNKLYHVPLPNEEYDYVFSIDDPKSVSKSSSVSADREKSGAKKISKRTDNHKSTTERIVLDQTKTLIDYGFTQSTKTLNVHLARNTHVVTRPAEFFDLLYMYAVQLAEAQVTATLQQKQQLSEAEGGLISQSLDEPVALSGFTIVPAVPRSLPNYNEKWQRAMASGVLEEPSQSPPTTVTTQDLQSLLSSHSGGGSGNNSNALAALRRMLATQNNNGSSSQDTTTHIVPLPPSLTTTTTTAPVSRKRASPDSHKSTPSPTAGSGLFGGLKKGFLGGSEKKVAKK